MWYLIVSIPDLCNLTYFGMKLCLFKPRVSGKNTSGHWTPCLHFPHKQLLSEHKILNADECCELYAIFGPVHEIAVHIASVSSKSSDMHRPAILARVFVARILKVWTFKMMARGTKFRYRALKNTVSDSQHMGLLEAFAYTVKPV